MESLILILIVIAVISIFIGLLPYILPILVVFGIIGYFSRKKAMKEFGDQVNNYSTNDFEQNYNNNTNPNVIDVEYTEREDTEE